MSIPEAKVLSRNHISSKLRSCSGLLLKCRKFLSINLLYRVFVCLGMSYINYFILIYSNISKYNFNAINRDFNHCGSIIYNCFSSCLEDYNWPDLHVIQHQLQLIFIHKVIHLGFAPPLKDLLHSGQVNKGHNLRNNHKLQTRRFNMNLGQKSFEY